MPRSFLFLGLCCFFLCASPARAQTSPLDRDERRPSARAAQRLLGISLPDLALRSSTLRSPVTEDRIFALRFPVTDHGAVQVATGYTRIVSAPNHFWNSLPAKATWKFKAVPITVGYEHALASRDDRLVPTVGAGLTLYLTRMKRLAAPHLASDIVDRPGFIYSRAKPSFAYGYGPGYGAQASLGLRYRLTQEVFLLGQSRLRYIDGLALADSDLGDRFVCLDFVLGFGVDL